MGDDATAFDMRGAELSHHGLDVVLRGLSMICGDDRVLDLTGPLFDGLYEFFRGQLLLGREPA
ncbi:hypothetical protein ABZ297_46555 [Nonomuraea sp. NPDC005983]|uniref:hypothetical protein n=1 Tax=Nonomuraea sp. NPDC005983 TaxID=3155595 RepID=UPI0033AEA896